MSIRILQLSDIHFSTKLDDDRFEHQDVREQMINDLRDEVVSAQGAINTVIIAGDIAFSGRKEEYDQAASWLERVTIVCGCKQTDVLPVPGNHDVDRKRIVAATKMIHKRLRSCSLPEAMQELIELAETKDGSLTDKLADYQAFAASYGCQFKSVSQPHWERQFPLDGSLRLSVLGLTSVQVCDADDQPRGLLLGKNQYIIDRPPGIEQIVVMHHPLDWLRDSQQAHEYLYSRARILIFGHEHYQQLTKITDPNGSDCLVLGSGALTPEHAHDPYIYRYNILELDIADCSGSPCLSVKVYPRVWVREHTRFEADTLRLGGNISAQFELRCPRFSVPTGKSSIAPPPATDERVTKLFYLYWRHLQWTERLKVLVNADSLPNVPQPPTLHSICDLGLKRARSEGTLGRVWELTMQFVPPDKREPNPF